MFDMEDGTWSDEIAVVSPDSGLDLMEESDMILLTVDVIYRV